MTTSPDPMTTSASPARFFLFGGIILVAIVSVMLAILLPRQASLDDRSQAWSSVACAGKVTVPASTCNGKCGVNADCTSGMVCYKTSGQTEGVCRNSANPTSATCTVASATPTPTPKPTAVTCGSKCTTTADCGSNSGLTCHENICKRVLVSGDFCKDTCPLPAQAGRTIVRFGGDKILVSSRGTTTDVNIQTQFGPWTVSPSLPAGSYKVWLASYDDHTNKPTQVQGYEKYFVELFDSSGVSVAKSSSISDLPQSINNLEATVNSSLLVPRTATAVRAIHANINPNNPDGSPNSIRPLCVAFDLISSATPTPVPNPGTAQLKVISNQKDAAFSFAATVNGTKSAPFSVKTNTLLGGTQYYNYGQTITQTTGTNVTYEAIQPPAGWCLKNVGVRESGLNKFSGLKCRFSVIPTAAASVQRMGLYEFEKCTTSNWAQTSCTYTYGQSSPSVTAAPVQTSSKVPSFRVGLASRTTGRYIEGYREIKSGAQIPNSVMQGATIYAYPYTTADVPLVRSVRFDVDGQFKRIDSKSSYSATETTGTSPASLGLGLGNHSVTVTTFQGTNGSGAAGTPVTIGFTVK